MTDEPNLVELIGPDAYIDAQAEAMDSILPGLGGLLRDVYRATLDVINRHCVAALYAIAGADTELDYYGGKR